MKKVAGKLKLAMAQYRELAAFAQFGTAELDKATRSQIERGQRITEVLKQLLYVPKSLENQIIILYAAINGYLDDIPVKKVVEFEDAFIRIMDTMHPEIGKDIKKTKDLSDKTEEELKAAIEEFKKGFSTE
jgi:F-type H+-transporting ATPase subunit alpha